MDDRPAVRPGPNRSRDRRYAPLSREKSRNTDDERPAQHEVKPFRRPATGTKPGGPHKRPLQPGRMRFTGRFDDEDEREREERPAGPAGHRHSQGRRADGRPVPPRPRADGAKSGRRSRPDKESPTRAGDRSKPRAEPGRGAAEQAIQVKWTGLRPLYDFWGERIPRYYSVEALARTISRQFPNKDKFIVPSVKQLLGPSPVVSLSFELFQEGKYQLIFLLRAINAKRKQAVFGFVAAKRAGDFSKVALQEHENLMILHQRAPEYVVRPFTGGRVMIVERRKPSDKPQEIYAYVTQWLGNYHELGVARTLQFYVNVKNPQLFTVAQTEDLKGQMVEIIARTYDPVRRDCMEMPQIASGDFVVTKPTQGRPRLRLIACRNLLRNMTPAKILHRIVEAQWDWGGRDFRLAPERADTVYDGLKRALGDEQAKAWLIDYRDQVVKGAFKARRPLTREALDELLA